MLVADVLQIVLGIPSVFVAGVTWERYRAKKETLQQALASAAKTLSHVRHHSTSINKSIFERGETIEISYEIESAEDIPEGVWLGASIRDGTNKMFNDISQDKPIPLRKGKHEYKRVLTAPVITTVGINKLNTNIWFGKVGDSNLSIRLGGVPQKDVRVK